MQKKEIRFSVEEYDSIEALPAEDADLLRKARAVTSQAYAPYSRFRVGAMARIANGEFVSGTNQENASYPAGICAERVLLSAASVLYPGIAIEALAVSYDPEDGSSDHPISPCGICRQSFQEAEQRSGRPIRLILGGLTGKITVIPQAGFLLPLAFSF